MNATIEKFGYPGTLVREYDHWVVLVRPKQVTLGSLILAAKDRANTLSALPQAAFTEMAGVTAAIEGALRRCFSYDKINYLLLMMVDPDVHFHVVPRYASPPAFAGVTFPDAGWPGPPNLSADTPVTPQALEAIRDELRRRWEER